MKYRGIFLNDEAPALTGWAKEKFGGLNSKFYSHVFELLLRLRANYRIHTVSSGDAAIEITLSPTLAFTPGRGLRVAVSVDKAAPQVVDLRLPVGDGKEDWGRTVTEAVRKVTTTHRIDGPGAHVIKVWMIDPAVVLQRVLLHFGEVPASYYGPTESVRR